MGVAGLTFVVLYIASLVVRDGYEMLKKDGRVDPTDGRVFAVVFSAMIVMWISWFGIGLVATPRLAVPDPLRWTGLGVVVLGAVLAVWGVVHLRGLENIDHLVTTGPFAKLRHPMYVGFAMWIVGWAAYQGAVASILLAPFGLASILWWRHLEELDLQSRYGEAYAAYRATTWV